MFEIIERVRQKKDREKKIIAFSLSLFFCSVIFIFWLFTVLPDFKKQEELDKKVQSAKNGPTENLTSFFGDNFKQAKEHFSKIRNVANVFQSEADYFKAETKEEPVVDKQSPTMDFSSSTEEVSI
ncbi:MAG TPA: hypothetical protein PLZ99_02200 [Parcubacteria group bacterium]|jgi:hypothetical protein|nr:hypothetical protein [Parcubacteria group bacterium]